jgi:hypothetical protein
MRKLRTRIIQLDHTHIRLIHEIHDELKNMVGKVRLENLIRELVRRKIMKRDSLGFAGSYLMQVTAFEAVRRLKPMAAYFNKSWAN